jgi:hypothetical protein
VALKVNLLPFFKVNLLASAPSTIVKIVSMFLNTFRVNIRVLQSRFDRGFEGNLPETAYKTLTVTVTKNPDDDGALRITTAADVRGFES